MADLVTPFRIAVPQADLDDLNARLKNTRWPDSETVEDWSQGMPLAYTQELCRYWATDYDWRASEERLNSFDQFRTDINGLGIHFIHVRSPHPDAMPLVITHGWPGSIVEFHKVIGPLVDPVAHGGDANDAFHVVCPSLPGYGFSDKPKEPGWNISRIAKTWDQLMVRLGYDRYFAQGGDWGAMVTSSLGVNHSDHVAGLHLNMPLAVPDLSQPLTDAEQASMDGFANYERWEAGYSKQQSTRPQTVGYGLADSPAGQAAWVVEKFWAWTDSDGHPENVLTRDELLDNVMLYWLPGAGASSARLYWESFADVDFTPINVPVGCSIFPKEIFRMSRRWAEGRFTDLRFWNEPEKGGHFAAFEQPDIWLDDVRSCFRTMR
ncbi:MAG: epoxide hydrolase family protein [Actinomycetes bacterium]